MHDVDPIETREWLDALDSVLTFEGLDRAHYLLAELTSEARRRGAPVPYSASTPYLNTIRPDREDRHPGDLAIEHRIRSMIRWNALAIVLRANKESSELGGHIASFQSAATLYDVGFQHFWRAPSQEHGGDLVFVQGHSSPGIYADDVPAELLVAQERGEDADEGHRRAAAAGRAGARRLSTPSSRRPSGARSPRA